MAGTINIYVQQYYRYTVIVHIHHAWCYNYRNGSTTVYTCAMAGKNVMNVPWLVL